MKVTLNKISRFTTDREGKQLMTKDKRPYTRVRIQTAEHADQWLSGFENGITQGWKEGDTIEIDVKQVGIYFNFSTPKKEDLLEARIKVLEDQIVKLGFVPVDK